MQDITIKTERLLISPRSIGELEKLYQNESDAEHKREYSEMLDTMRRLPGREEWGSDWKICLSCGTEIGGIGFKGVPDESGTVELGYAIFEQYRRNGYATEAVGGITKWALANEDVRVVTAQTDADNSISQRVLLKNGFVRDGDGEEGPLFKVFKSKGNAAMIGIEDFNKVEVRVGTIIGAEINKKARNPAYKLTVDLGSELGIKHSSAQITELYTPEALIGRQAVFCVNLTPMHIGSVKSEVRILGALSDKGVVLLMPIEPVANGDKIE